MKRSAADATEEEPLVADPRADASFLGLVHCADPGRFRFVVEERLTRLDGRLYGGTAIAVSIASAEQVTQRRALWMTTQFVSTVGLGAEMTAEVEVLAAGRRTQQVRVTGTDATGGVVFASLGATGHHRDEGLCGVFERCPVVDPPEKSEPWANPLSGMARAIGMEIPPPPWLPNAGFSGVIELRHAEIVDHPDPGPGRICLWVRRKDRQVITPALAAYVADVVPMSIAHACRVVAFGTSLDNSIRIGSFVESDWVLLDLRPQLAVGDYGHGTVHVWSAEGQLMATASQTASLHRFDGSFPPWGRSQGSTGP